MGPNEEKVWDEYYIPTVGMSKITFANEHGFIALDQTADQKKSTVNFSAKVFTIHPGETMNVMMSLTGKKNYDLGTETFTGDPKAASEYNVTKAKKTIIPGKYTYQLVMKSAVGEILAQAEIPVTIK